MAWVKIDDQFFLKPRARRAGKDGRALFFAGLCYCAANRTDGLIVAEALPVVAALAEVQPDVADLLLNVGLWTDVPDGYEVVDFLKYNPSRAQLEADAAAAAERQSRARSRRDSQRDTTENHAVSPTAPVPSPSPDALSSSSTVHLGLPLDLWTTIADKKLRIAKGITNPSGWKRRVADNAQVELTDRAVALVERYDLTTSQLADVLISDSNPAWLRGLERSNPEAS